MKKLLCFLLVLVFMMSLVTVVWADVDITDEAYDKVEQHVDKANDKINHMVSIAQDQADKNNADMEKIVAQLLKKTDHFAAKAIEYGENFGVVVECEYNEVVIGDQIVLVDPLRIRRY
jgi:predicted PurR-regulated permease PerM